jgi:hypothetical protein
MQRRGFLRTATLAGLSGSALGQTCPAAEGTVRDRIWVFANPVNADFDMVGERSVMSPLEAAVYHLRHRHGSRLGIGGMGSRVDRAGRRHASMKETASGLARRGAWAYPMRFCP